MRQEKIDCPIKGLVSIIVPIYNADKYIGECIESIVSQTYTNLEIILIDDGSKDNSAMVCRHWERKDHRIRLIQQSNAGVSAARNKGMLESVGEYIAFVDADDTLQKDAIDVLVNGIRAAKADIFISDLQQKISQMPFCEYLLLKRRVSVWGILFRASILQNVLFQEELSNNEDFVFLFNLGLKTNSVAGTNRSVYNYNFTTPHSLSKIKSVCKLNSTLKACEIIERKLPENLNEAFKVYIYYMYCYVLTNVGTVSDLSSLRKPVSELKKYIRLNYFSWFRHSTIKTKAEIIKFALLAVVPQSIINAIKQRS